MFVNDRVRVVKLDRQAVPAGHGVPAEDRSVFVEREGSLTMRLNVAWDPELGALWRVRFDDRTEAVFAESELGVLDAQGGVASEMEELQDSWGQAPRAGSMPFRRRVSSGSGQAVMAFIALSLAGLLLIGAGVAQADLRISAAGGVLILIGLGAAAAMVS